MELQILDKKLVDLRITQMELRDELMLGLRELHRRKHWKELGFKSISDYCIKELGLSAEEVREVLVQLGLIVQTKDLVSSDAATQRRIDALKTWRKKKSSQHALAAYRVLSNRTLLHLAHSNPKTLEALAKVPGIGPRKLQDFGEEILKLLPWYDLPIESQHM